uniref:Uncharacterized protein LOC111100585 isoform X2 n=1 Tax=Crassostrea virginica TaxID=6565 RepID=A0A8B8AA63_CRAVI|nr:uncharacterized protein LOC111100585 isoform X2 [Crassostrea virginica]
MPRERSYSPRRSYRSRTPEKYRKRSRSPKGSRSPRRSRSYSPKYRGKKQYSPKRRSPEYYNRERGTDYHRGRGTDYHRGRGTDYHRGRGRGNRGYNVPYGRKPPFEKRKRSPFRRDSGHRYSRSHSRSRSPSPKKQSRSPRRKSPELTASLKDSRPIREEKRRDPMDLDIGLGRQETSTFPVTMRDAFNKSTASSDMGQYKSFRNLSPDTSLSAQPPGVIGSVTVAPPSVRRPLLSQRFENIDTEFVGPVRVDENITIGIHRTGPNLRNTPNKPVVRDFDPFKFVMLRRRDEGKKPIFDREEIKIFGLDKILDEQIYEEKRTISVVPSDEQRRSIRSSSRYSQDRDTRTVKSSDRSREPTVRLNPKPDPRYEKLFQESEGYESKSINPNDLRHNLMKRKYDDEDDDSYDARQRLDGRRKGGRDYSDRDRKKSLGKYKFEAWKENPEMIPKHPMYFEHDNREKEFGSRGRFGNNRFFRGGNRRPFRGGFRGRGFRGGYRGRNFGGYKPTSHYYSSKKEGDEEYDKRYGFHYKSSDKRPRDSGTWKHDLYDTIESEDGDKAEDKSHDDEKPSSTTVT